MIRVDLRFGQSITAFGQTAVGSVIKALDKQLKPADAMIGVRVVKAVEVRRLNKKYASKDEFTDVLSFNYAEGALLPGQEKTGDVVISYQHVLGQARRSKTPAETELALLVLHGVMHLLGYDHQDKAQRDKLDKLQANIMEKAGLTYRDFAWQD